MARGTSRRRDGHSSRTPVARRIKQPTRMTGLDRPEARASTPFLFGLAPGGVCRAASVAGNAVRSYRTVSPLPRLNATRRGGLFSVALSLGPAPARRGSPRRTLSGTVCPWSPDFPPRPPFGISAERPSGRLTGLAMGITDADVKACRAAGLRNASLVAARRLHQLSGDGRVSMRARSVRSVDASATPSIRACRK
jgi:hypothetical protein